ncbi:MAG: Ig-like domain-containing protein [Candidatus Nanopelagicales bacterium]
MRALTRVTAAAMVSGLALTMGVSLAPAAWSDGGGAGVPILVGDAGPLAAPTGLTATAGDGSATISFTAPASDDTAPITNYAYSVNAGGSWVDFSPAVTASPVTITGLSNGTTYSIQLRAINKVGPGAASVAVSVTPKAPKPPKPAAPPVFKVDNQVITKYVKVKAGVTLKVTNVAKGATVEVVGYDDPSLVIPARATSKAGTWTTDPIRPSVRLWARVVGSDGTVLGKVNFATEKAENTFSLDVFPAPGKFGIGIPLVVNFSAPITDKAAVEQAMVVTSDKDFGEAGWFWVDNTKAVFRPRSYWPGNATITLTADLTGVQGAGTAWGPNVTKSFQTSDAVYLAVNLRKKTMDYYLNGKVTQTFPVSGGRPGFETASGIKLITTHESPRRLYNPDPKNGWDVKVEYAMRISNDGEFIHSAPWNGSIGYANLSHGCINMTTTDAGWIFQNTDFATPVDVKGSSIPAGTSNYLAGYWNYTWQEWKRGSALWKDS